MYRTVFLLLAVIFSTFSLAQTGPQEGEVAPTFSGVDQYGETIILDSLLNDGPVVLFFYRGQWCPYCRQQVKLFQDSLEAIHKLGATVVAVVPEKQEYIDDMTENTGAMFSILYDSGYKIMDDYRVTFALKDRLIKRYDRLGADFSESHGMEEVQLPVPATYVIGKDGVIMYQHFDPDYTKRASMDDIIAILLKQN